MSCTKDIPLLYRSLILLYKNVKCSKNYPVVVFHDDINQVNISRLMVELHRSLGYMPDLSFEYLEFKFPDGFKFDESLVDHETSLNEFKLGYRHMCRFQCHGIYAHPRLMNYDYYWRLDSDSFILGPVDFDVFDQLFENNYEYAYVGDEDREVPRVAKDLWMTTNKWLNESKINRNNIDGKLVNGEWDYNLFYTNFEISKFSFWRSEPYISYFKALDATGNFYYKRWGDAPIHWLAVRALMDDSKVYKFDNIPYMHNQWIRNLKSLPSAHIASDVMQCLNGTVFGQILDYVMERYRKTGIDKNNFGEKYNGVY